MEIFCSIHIEPLSNQTILPSPVFLRLKTEGEKTWQDIRFFTKDFKKGKKNHVRVLLDNAESHLRSALDKE